MEPLASAVLLGFVLGLQHATDPDHLVAVATIVSRERRFASGAVIGAAWGAGHMLAVGVAGGAIIALDLSVPHGLALGLEVAVAGMLVALGVLRLREALADLRGVPADRLAADHDHGARTTVHRHDGGDAHVHPSRRMLSALGAGGRAVHARAFVVGVVHGLAGSAAAALFVMATLRSAAGAALYLLVFGLGTITAMTVLTAALALPVGAALRVRRARTVLGVGAGLGSIIFGAWYGLRLL